MNRIFVLSAVLLMLGVREGNAATSQIKCYQCSSMKSHEDCAVNKTVRQCEINIPGFDWTCGKYSSGHHSQNISTVAYARDCVLAKKCKEDAFCKSKRNMFQAVVGINSTDRLAEFSCEMHCCGKDLCNSAPSGLAFGFILNSFFAVATWYILLYFK